MPRPGVHAPGRPGVTVFPDRGSGVRAAGRHGYARRYWWQPQDPQSDPVRRCWWTLVGCPQTQVRRRRARSWIMRPDGTGPVVGEGCCCWCGGTRCHPKVTWWFGWLPFVDADRDVFVCSEAYPFPGVGGFPDGWWWVRAAGADQIRVGVSWAEAVASARAPLHWAVFPEFTGGGFPTTTGASPHPPGREHECGGAPGPSPHRGPGCRVGGVRRCVPPGGGAASGGGGPTGPGPERRLNGGGPGRG